jgi:hypothetical protein
MHLVEIEQYDAVTKDPACSILRHGSGPFGLGHSQDPLAGLGGVEFNSKPVGRGDDFVDLVGGLLRR